MLRIRAATFEDAPAIGHLLKRNGMGELDAAAWRNRWEAYPFAAEFRDIPTGWVLETEQGSIAGNLDNVHLLYDLGGRRIKATIASAWTVDPEHRGKALQLMTTFLRQKGIDLALVVSASATTAQVLTAMKIPRIPLPDYGTPCFWAVDPRAFARAALVRKSIPGAAVLAWPAGFALLLRDAYYRTSRGRDSPPVRRLMEFDNRFDGLWSTPRLRAVRTRAVLEWRFRSELHSGRAAILVAEHNGTLLGYAVVVRRAMPELGMELCEVADIQARDDNPATMCSLLQASCKVAREEGADAVKFMTGTPAKRAPADALHPYTYRLPFWQLYFKAATPELATALSTADAWDFSLFETY